MLYRAFSLYLAIVGTMFVGGCASKLVHPLIDELAVAPDYFDELGRWSKAEKVYSELEIRYFINVTYLSTSLLKAYLADYARRYKLNIEEQAKMYSDSMAKAQAEESFFVAIFSPGRNWDKIDLSDEIWRLRLNGSGETTKANSIKSESLTDPRIGYYFPYVETWTSNYRVAFPAKPPASRVDFSLQGVIGNTIFSWQKP